MKKTKTKIVQAWELYKSQNGLKIDVVGYYPSDSRAVEEGEKLNHPFGTQPVWAIKVTSKKFIVVKELILVKLEV